MSIFGSTKVTGSNFTADETMNVSRACMVDMLESFSKEIYQITAATYIADIRMEEAVSEGASIEAVMEGVVGGFFDRIVAAFRKLGDKIKGWFKAFRKWLDLIFKHGKDFVTRFKTDLHEKNASGYEYESYKYSASAGNAKANVEIDKASAKIKSLCNDMTMDAAKQTKSWEDSMAAKKDDSFDKEYKTSKDSEDFFKDKSKRLEDIKKAFRGGADEKTTLKDFEGNSKGDMMTFISGSRDSIKEIQDAETTLTRDIDEVISALEKSKDQFKDKDEVKGGNVGRLINHITSQLKDCVSMQSSVNEIRKTMIGEMASAFESILKGYLRYKPAKAVSDSYIPESDDTMSLLESSMKLV